MTLAVVAYLAGWPFAWAAAFRFLLHDFSGLGDGPDDEDRVHAFVLATLVTVAWPVFVLPPWLWQQLRLAHHLAQLSRLVVPDNDTNDRKT